VGLKNLVIKLVFTLVLVAILRYFYVFMLENGLEVLGFIFFVGGVRAMWNFLANMKDNILRKSGMYDEPSN